MKIAPPPPDEPERIAQLRSYAILDTPAEVQFDAITRLVSTLLGVPISLVSLVDIERQWFKSHHGLDVRQTDRDLAFCSHVVASCAPMVVADARLDERFADNPLVTGEPHVRFYAGMPLRTPDGHVLGTLCAIDREPRELTAEQQESLAALADQVMQLLELRRVGRLLVDERRELALGKSELLERDRTMQAVFGGMVEGVVLQDQQGAILAHNAAAESILGLTHDELVGRSSVDPRWRAMRPDGTPFPGDAHPAMVTLRTGQPLDGVEMCVHRPDGDQRWISINSRPLFSPGEPLPSRVVVTFHDITERRMIAERLSRHQRLVTTGTLAAGVGHEINNPLTYILTNVSLAIEELELISGGSPSRRQGDLIRLLEQALDGAERVKRIVRGLKSLAREEADLLPTDVNTVVETAVQMANHELRTQATVTRELASVALVQADDSRLAQVLINLLVNAAQAFPRAEPSTNRIIIRTRIDNGVIIEVEDNGPGIQPDILPRIFDPFFTTKQVGVGTGLGLAISHGIITALGGEITCDTALGRGTTFRIRLPLAVQLPEFEPAPQPSVGRLLVVDDETVILKSLTRLFQGEFEVVTHSDPREALRSIEAGEQFDLVFCDLTMPYLSGMQLHAAVAAIRPQLAERFVFISGDISREDIRTFLARVPNERIEKPFSMQNLRGIARRFIGAKK